MRGKTVFDIQIGSAAFLALREIIEYKLNLKRVTWSHDY